MSTAQRLYEHGLITYMRTDASHYSNDFIDTVKTHINKKFNSDRYISSVIFLLSSTTSNNTGETSSAHESIRPTNIKVETIEDMASSGFTPREIKVIDLYGVLQWSRVCLMLCIQR